MLTVNRMPNIADLCDLYKVGEAVMSKLVGSKQNAPFERTDLATHNRALNVLMTCLDLTGEQVRAFVVKNPKVMGYDLQLIPGLVDSLEGCLKDLADLADVLDDLVDLKLTAEDIVLSFPLLLNVSTVVVEEKWELLISACRQRPDSWLRDLTLKPVCIGKHLSYTSDRLKRLSFVAPLKEIVPTVASVLSMTEAVFDSKYPSFKATNGTHAHARAGNGVGHYAVVGAGQ
jgi:hypothetical protein